MNQSKFFNVYDENNIRFLEDKCTGCTACMNSCPKKAICMVEDPAGFTYPQINTERCVDCGICVSVCPVAEPVEQIDTRVSAYYGAVTDANVVAKSSSGGAFSMMAEYVLAQDGVVFGAAFDYETMDLLYMSTNACTLDDLRRSKYIASQPREVFSEVKLQLEKGSPVLFFFLSVLVKKTI